MMLKKGLKIGALTEPVKPLAAWDPRRTKFWTMHAPHTTSSVPQDSSCLNNCKVLKQGHMFNKPLALSKHHLCALSCPNVQ